MPVEAPVDEPLDTPLGTPLQAPDAEAPAEAPVASSMPMSRLFAFALGGTLLLLAPLLVGALLVMRGRIEAPVAEAARPFDLPALDGSRITQAAFSDRVVVVNVWASWCGPCRAEAPVLRRMAERASEVAYYGVVSLDAPMLARAFAESEGLNYPHAVDDGTFSRAHNVTVIPTTLVFAKDGSFVGRIEGPLSEARLQTLIDDAIAVGSR